MKEDSLPRIYADFHIFLTNPCEFVKFVAEVLGFPVKYGSATLLNEKPVRISINPFNLTIRTLISDVELHRQFFIAIPALFVNFSDSIIR